VRIPSPRVFTQFMLRIVSGTDAFPGLGGKGVSKSPA